MPEQPKVLTGGIAVDDRGSVSFVNEFNFKGIKRFYVIRNFSKQTIRAFHGHLKEAKYIYVASGSAIIAAVRMTSTKNPDKNQEVQRFILSDKSPSVFYIPPGYANGFKVLEENTVLILFSTSTLEESKNDDYRFPHDYWGSRVWEIENR